MKFFTNFFLEHFIRDKRFCRFILVGILNTIIGYSIYAVFIWLNFHYVWAALFSTVIGTVFNFMTTGRLVFKNSQNHLFLKFVLVYALIYVLNITVIKVVTSFYGNQYFGGAVALFIAVPITFLLNKNFVFKGKV
ncbi:MAG: hypothetical protein A2X78_02965 [Gammaproteobacteria bacterium GWE2_37_16]|nr:MAG: hypothetical protein A2X78_02965 [Gammaproteobacteria bacterium GWE2_37_16]